MKEIFGEMNNLIYPLQVSPKEVHNYDELGCGNLIPEDSKNKVLA